MLESFIMAELYGTEQVKILSKDVTSRWKTRRPFDQFEGDNGIGYKRLARLIVVNNESGLCVVQLQFTPYFRWWPNEPARVVYELSTRGGMLKSYLNLSWRVRDPLATRNNHDDNNNPATKEDFEVFRWLLRSTFPYRGHL